MDGASSLGRSRIPPSPFPRPTRPAAFRAVASCRARLCRRSRPAAMAGELAHPARGSEYLLKQSGHTQIDVSGFPVQPFSGRAHLHFSQLVCGNIPKPRNQLYGNPEARTVGEIDGQRLGEPIIACPFRRGLAWTKSLPTLLGGANLRKYLCVRESLIRHVLLPRLPAVRRSILRSA